MKKSMLVLVVLVLVAAVFLYSGGYFGGSDESASNTVSVVQGWNDITIPDSWPDTTAAELMRENPSITTVSYWSTSGVAGHWVSCVSVMPFSNNFDITAGMEITVMATGSGMITSPG